MSKIAIVYGSSSGTTEAIASKVKGLIGDADLFNVDNLKVEALAPYNFLIIGTSTTGMGDLQDDWDAFLPKFSAMDFSGKKVAFFGLGDSSSFSDTFANGMGTIYEAIKDKVKVVGAVSTDGYTYDDSTSVVDGQFIGLALDEDNEYDQTDSRLSNWIEIIKPHLQ